MNHLERIEENNQKRRLAELENSGITMENGIIQVINGTVSTPSIRGAATNSGIFFGSGTTSLSTAGSHTATLDGQGDLNISTGGITFESYENDSATPGNTTNNAISGRVAITGGAVSVAVANSKVVATSIILCQVETIDATLKNVSVVPGSSTFTITGNANSTGAVTISYIVFNS